MQNYHIVPRGRKMAHRLCGDIVTNHVATKKSRNVMDAVMLWDLWLGNMSEKGLKTMNDQRMLLGIKCCDLDLCEHYIFCKTKESSV